MAYKPHSLWGLCASLPLVSIVLWGSLSAAAQEGRICVEQGEVEHRHYKTDWNKEDGHDNGPLYRGEGTRQVTSSASYQLCQYEKTPDLIYGIVGLHGQHDRDVKIELTLQQNTRDGFVLNFKTWDGARMGMVKVRWMAIGYVESF